MLTNPPWLPSSPRLRCAYRYAVQEGALLHSPITHIRRPLVTRHADPRTTRRYDRARHALDRHATYTLAAFIAEVLPSPIGDVD
jgi:hypothetical protein